MHPEGTARGFSSVSSRKRWSRCRRCLGGGGAPSQMVVSGTVSADVNGVAATPANVQVNARTGFDGPAFPPPVDSGMGPWGPVNPATGLKRNPRLPDVPKRIYDLHDAGSWVVVAADSSPWFEKINAGPNTGLWFAKDQPLTVRVEIAINTVAMQAGSAWAAQQPKTRVANTDPTKKPWCAQSEIPNPVLGLVQRHEGIVTDPNSQYAPLEPTYTSLLSAGVERLVLTRSPVPTDFQKMILDAENRAQLASAAITHSTTGNPMNQQTCQYIFQ